MAMTTEHEKKPPSVVRELLEGVLADAQMLIQQQLAIFRNDLNHEIEKAREAAAFVIVGVAIVTTGGILFSLMLVYLLVALYPTLPLWAGFGIVGIPIIAIGSVVCFIGTRKFTAEDDAEEAVAEEGVARPVLKLKEITND